MVGYALPIFANSAVSLIVSRTNCIDPPPPPPPLSGWTKMYEYATIITGGKADGLLTCPDVSGVKRSRYEHQVTLAGLHTLTMDAFKSQSEFSNYSDWHQNLENESVTAKFWFTVIYMQVLLFMFICSLRDSNFALLFNVLRKCSPG